MRRLLLCVAFLFGCNDGGVTGGNNALVGTWTATFIGKTLSYTFSADGTISFDVDGKLGSGTWKATGPQIVVDAAETGGKNHARVTQTFLLSGDRLAMPDYNAVGATQGVVGAWKTSSRSEIFATDGTVMKTVQSETTYELLADGSAKWITVYDGMTNTLNGTWTASGASACSMAFGVVTSSCEIVDGKMAFPVLRRVTR